MKKVSFAILFFVAMLALSCNDDDAKKEQVCYLKKVNQNGKTINLVTYNADNYPINVSLYDDLGLLSNSFDIEHNSKGQPTKLTSKNASSSVTSYSEHQYNVNELIGKTSNYTKNSGGDFELQSYYTYEYDGDKKLIKTSLYASTGGIFSVYSYDTYQYDSNKNITQVSSYIGTPGVLDETIDVEYDTKHSYLAALKGFVVSVEYFSEHNVTKKTIKDKSGNVKSTSLTITYEYNDIGYTTKVTQTELGGEIRIYDLENDCR